MGKTNSESIMRSLLSKALMTMLLLFPAMNVLNAGTLSAKDVKGAVVSAADGEPLIGATVQVQGAQGGGNH